MSHQSDYSLLEMGNLKNHLPSYPAIILKQECIPVGCVPPVHWSYLIVSAMHAPPPSHARPHPLPRTPPCGQNSWPTLLEILPCPNFVAGGNNCQWYTNIMTLWYRQLQIRGDQTDRQTDSRVDGTDADNHRSQWPRRRIMLRNQ